MGTSAVRARAPRQPPVATSADAQPAGFGESRRRLRARLAIATAVLCSVHLASAQESAYRMPANKPEAEIDFLANYYTQDGDFGAPQGGIGTEQLDNLAGVIYVNVPLDSNSAVAVAGGVDYYSSASTDRIDRQLSTASASDVRGYGSVTYTERRLATGRSYRATLGYSQEYDVTSFSAALGFSQEWDSGQNELSLTAQALRDDWQLIYPVEFRRRNPPSWRGPLDTDIRETYVLSAVYSRIMTRRVQLAVSADLISMRGLLSTPFHRIYYLGNADPRLDASDIERLPDTRLRLPVSLRVNVKPNDVLVVRSLWRYYVDDWGIRAPSLDVELAYDLTEAWTVTPFGRYYRQAGSRYYAGFAEHAAGAEFYTSDYDLATLSTTKVGLSLRYAPVLGLARGRVANYGIDWRAIILRGAYYVRDAGLQAFTVTLGTKLAVTRGPKLNGG